jgi:hypothetical protein
VKVTLPPSLARSGDNDVDDDTKEKEMPEQTRTPPKPPPVTSEQRAKRQRTRYTTVPFAAGILYARASWPERSTDWDSH